MDTLLLRLAAPMQSWGSSAKFDKRGTEREPTKSGVIGMLAAALGWRRDCDLEALSDYLRFGVRVDREGALLTDLQIAKSAKKSIGSYREYLGDEDKVNATYLTYRDYLCDAIFLVGLEGKKELLEKLAQALENPIFPLYLGRRSCPPEGQIVLGIEEGKELEEALGNFKLLNTRKTGEDLLPLRLLIEKRELGPNTYIQRDKPISFHPEKREYGSRITEESMFYPPRTLTEEVLQSNFETNDDYFTGIKSDK